MGLLYDRLEKIAGMDRAPDTLRARDGSVAHEKRFTIYVTGNGWGSRLFFKSNVPPSDGEAVKKLNLTVISNPEGVRNLVFKSEISQPLRGLEITEV